MTAILFFLVLLAVIGGVLVVASFSAVRRAAEDELTRRFQRRLQLQHQQFLAEQRLQQLTQEALQAMLDESRPSSTEVPPAGEWYQP